MLVTYLFEAWNIVFKVCPILFDLFVVIFETERDSENLKERNLKKTLKIFVPDVKKNTKHNYYSMRIFVIDRFYDQKLWIHKISNPISNHLR